MRVDIDGEVATFRRVAVRDDVQRRGHGRSMLTGAEQFARHYGCLRIESHADAGPIGFYERCGFQRATDVPSHAETVLMIKALV